MKSLRIDFAVKRSQAEALEILMRNSLLGFGLILSLVACGGDDDAALVDSGTDTSVSDAGVDANEADAAVDASEDAGEPDAEVDAAVEDAAPDVFESDLPSFCRDRMGPAYDQACDINLEHITIGETERPAETALFPNVATQFNMNGWEWWQKWPGGLEPTFEASEATDAALKCSVASALRFAYIMFMHTPPELVDTLNETTWEGRFFNWNDDYSEPGSVGSADGAQLWAWEWYLIKWISQTAADGTCYLPTLEMLESAATRCLNRANVNDGVIQGCTN